MVYGFQVLTFSLPYSFFLEYFGGDKRDRTVDPLLAKQVLSQLSYTPIETECLYCQFTFPFAVHDMFRFSVCQLTSFTLFEFPFTDSQN